MNARLLGWVAAAGFLLSAVVHIATFAGHSLLHRFPPLWLLAVGIFAVFGPAVFVIAEASKRGRLGALFGSYPITVLALAAVLHFYVTIVGLASFTRFEGVAEERVAGYVLVNRGEVIRELSRDEFLAAQAADTRGSSAIWLDFYGLSSLFWFFRRTLPDA